MRWCGLHANLSLGGLLPNIGRHRLHLRVNLPIGREHFAVTRMIRFAREIGDHSAGFLHQQHTRSCVPGFQAKFPESLEAAGRTPAKIKSSRAVAPHAVRSKSETSVKSDVRLLAALIRRKSSDEQTRGQRLDLRNMYAFVVQVGAFTAPSREHLPTHRIQHHAHNRLAIFEQSDRTNENRETVR